MQLNRLYIISFILLTNLLPLKVISQPNQASARKNRNIEFLTEAAPGYSLQEEKYDVTFYFIDLEVTNQSTFIKGSSTLHAQRIAADIDTFVVEISQKLRIDSVFLQEKKQEYFFHENDLLKIVLSGESNKYAVYRLKVFYQGTAGSGGFYSGISSATAPSTNQKITYTLSEPFQGKDWFAVKQNLTDKADSSWVFITVDSNLKAGSNGLLTDVKTLADGKKRYEWKSNYPIAYYLLSFSVGDYSEYSFYASLNDTDSVLVQNYLYNSPGIFESEKEEIDQTTPLLKLFSESFGKYPFAKEKYGHCMAPMGGGMEHQTMTTIAGFDFGIISHELAHSWFGDYLTCGTWQDIWINEGFASYAEYIALEGLKTQKECIEWLDQAHNYAINYPYEAVFLSPLESRDAKRIFNYSLTYKKGGSIIHMLRYEINNDSLFFAIIRDYISVYANSTAIGDDFRKIVENHTGKEFGWFFDQWYYGKGHPVFLTNWRQIGDTLILTSSQTSSTGENNFFRTHMDYRIHYTNGEKEDIQVLYEKPGEVFRFFAPDEIQYIQIDPLSNVLKNAVIYKYSDITKVFSVNPNPFINEINLTFRNNIKNREINLSGLNGKIYYNQTSTSGSLTLDLSFLNPGIYLLNVKEDGIKYTEKLLKI
jgi:aminopeptidase N